MPRKFFVGGNFKMNGTLQSIKDIVIALNDAKLNQDVEVVIAPPALYLLPAREHLRKDIQVAAQNVYDKPSGAFTGEISIGQLKDAGVQWVILGHSERRTLLQETDQFVASKVAHALEGGINVIFCCGDSLEEKEAGKTLDVVSRQVEAVAQKISDWTHVVIAYEPIYAIGTGKAAPPSDAQETHAGLRAVLAKKIGQEKANAVRIIYGGSVTAKNCGEFASCPDVDGFLVGGASLKPEFRDIINARM